MHSNLIQLIENEVQAMDDFARSNPLRCPDDPRQIDEVLFLALRNPNWTGNQIIEYYERKRGRALKLRVQPILHKHRLAKADGREGCVHEIDDYFPVLQTLIESNDQAQAEIAYRKLLPWLGDHRRLSGPVVGRVLLASLADDWTSDDDPQLQKLGKHIAAVLSSILLIPSLRLLRKIIYRVAEARGFRERASLADQLEEMITAVDDVAGSEVPTDHANYESLGAENADLKAALFGLKRELTGLQQQISTSQEAAKTDAVVALLSEMNSATNGHLLDNMVHSSRVVSQLLREGWQPEPIEIEGVIYSLKMLVDYFERIGLNQMRTVGNHEKIAMDDLAYLSYVGSEFDSPDDVKWIEFRTSGWKYRDRVISRPQAVEVPPKYATD